MPMVADSVEAHAFQANKLLKDEDCAGAALEAGRALNILPVLAQTAVVRGQALLSPLLDQLMSDDAERPAFADFKPAWESFMMAERLEPGNAEAKQELEKLQTLLAMLEMQDESAKQNGSAHGHDHVHSHDHENCGDAHCEDTACSAHEHCEDQACPATASAADATVPSVDVVIVGAGASGVGCGLMLTKVFGLDPSSILLVERGNSVGASFRMWPAEMAFISPSFNQQGWTNSFDLNSVAFGTSPAYSLHAEHPTGAQYADYLSALADAAELNVRTATEVSAISAISAAPSFDENAAAPSLFEVRLRPAGNGGGEEQRLRARYVIWAAGEFQYPKPTATLFPGSELCLHNSTVRSWRELPGDDFVIIGGYESGIDAAVNLAAAGKRATVVASTPFWEVATADPSTELAPYTAARLRATTAASCATPPRLLSPLRATAVEAVDAAAGGGYVVRATWTAAPELPDKSPLRVPAVTLGSDAAAVELHVKGGGEVTEAGWEPTTWAPPAVGSEMELHTPVPPVLATGFEGSVKSKVVRPLFAWPTAGDKGCAMGAPLLTMEDESTLTPGLFLAGPTVRHGELSFCFVYKFRQRFGIVADAICRGLGRDTAAAVEQARKMNMFLDDLSCCKSACGESC